MFSTSDFTTGIANAVLQLQRVASLLDATQCPPIQHISVNVAELSYDRIEEIVETVPSGHARRDKDVADFVYVIQSRDKAKISDLRLLLETARKTENDYSRVNPDTSATTTIYVGRSKTVRGRLRQHLGAESQGVYSLHLQRWATSLDLDIDIYILRFENADDLLVQAIENGIWVSLKPAFGRKGER